MEIEELETAQRAERLLWGDRVGRAARRKIVEICDSLGVPDPDSMMACMHFETRGTFSPAIRNPTSGATGLIQFLPSTAEGLGTTVEALSQMSVADQLEWVEAYFQPYSQKMTEPEDLYMAILWPRAVGKPLDTVLFRRGEGAYERNQGLDHNGDGTVTKREASKPILERLADATDADRPQPIESDSTEVELTRLAGVMAAVQVEVATLTKGQARVTHLLERSLTEEYIVRRKADLDLSSSGEPDESSTANSTPLQPPPTKSLFGAAPRVTIE